MNHNEANTNWIIKRNSNGMVLHDDAKLAVLMDIRAELREIKISLGVLRCHNFIAIPRILRAIQANTRKKKRTKKQ